ncbi:hypothetical protein BVRB_3g062000 [Beta vulgaris subsp. vulgaris]|nr:hypothetical protein BVRB_3g062000 [Beta vulgaris subsp. vulgaris]
MYFFQGTLKEQLNIIINLQISSRPKNNRSQTPRQSS